MKRILYIFVIILLTGCRSSKTVSTSSQMSDGHTSDSTAVMDLQIEAGAWAVSNDSSVAASTHYGVVRDSAGRPVLDSLGAPMVYVERRDTVWRVVTIDKGAHETIVRHDTVRVIQRDTLFIDKIRQEQIKTKIGASRFSMLLLGLCIIVTLGFIFVHNSGSSDS